MLLSLDIQTPTGGSYTIAIGSGDVDIGRSATCAIRLPYAAVSSRHLRLSTQNGRWMAADLGSKNGTLVDGRPLTERQLAPLSDGTRIQIGAVLLNVRLDEETSDGFTMSESGTMLRKLVAESAGPDGSSLSGAYLLNDEGERISVPDFATDLRPTEPPELRIDRRGHGFWVTPLIGTIKLAGRELAADGAPLQDGQRIEGAGQWVFHDPLESHVAALDDGPHDEPRVEQRSPSGRGFESVVLAIGGAAMVIAGLALLVIFEVI